MAHDPAWKDKMEATIEKWQAKIDQMKAEGKGKAADMRGDLDKDRDFDDKISDFFARMDREWDQLWD